MNTNYRRHRFPSGTDLIHACMTYGLADLHDHSFPRPGAIRFFATAYCGAFIGLGTTEYEAEFRRGGGIRITPLTTHLN